jgi:hypothetical protein
LVSASFAENGSSTIILLLKVGIIMNESDRSQTNTIPNVHVPENERVLSYLKEMHPFKEIIVPFSEKRVSQDTVPADLIGRLSSMSGLPENSKYVVYGREALVHPETGIIFGFISGTNVIYRLPDTLLEEVREGNISNFRTAQDMGMDLESNWVTSRSITEQLVVKCFEYYGQVTGEQEVVHLDFDLDLTTPRTPESEKQERSRRLLPLAMMILACALIGLVWYAFNSF